MTRIYTRICLFTLCLLVLILPASTCLAYEKTLSYDTQIHIQPDGSLNIVEWIKVKAEGDRIKHGIYRSIPVGYRINQGATYGFRIGIDVTIDHVTMNGRKVDWFTRKDADFLQLYIGDKDVLLKPGIYTYAISYTVNRAIMFEQDHDRIYWNAIGQDWQFNIDNASTTIILPPEAEVMALDAFVGPYGSVKRHFYRTNLPHGVRIEADRSLYREAFTIDLQVAKGLFQPPTAKDRMRWFAKDNAWLLIALSLLSLVVLYYTWAWRRAGKDPAPETLIAYYAPPAGLSAASMRYMRRHFYDERTFTAALVSLAIKGHILIEYGDESGHGRAGIYTISRPDYPEETPKALSAGEQTLLNTLLPKPGTRIAFTRANHGPIGKAYLAHKSHLANAHQDVHFRHNLHYVIGGLCLSALGLMIIFAVMPHVNIWFFVLATLFAGLNWQFWTLMRAPTLDGQRLLDKVEGFRHYLSVAEADRIAFHNAPNKTPDLFEAYLPFAIALDIEQEWSAQFASIIPKTADSGTADYRPRWYAGHAQQGPVYDISSFSSDLGTNLQNATYIAISPARSSGGGGFGGGGSAGGGFGGGGGGGW